MNSLTRTILTARARGRRRALPFVSAVAGTVLAAVIGLAVTSCRSIHNYTAADVPIRRFSHASAPAAGDTGFTVASYNIRYGEHIAAAAAEIARDRHLSRAEVLLLQEMDAAGVDSLARCLGLNAVYAPASRDESGRGFGNAILTRGVLSDPQALVLPYAHPLTGRRRIALLATVRLGEHELRVASVHLETPPLHFERRLEQAGTVCDALAKSDDPLLVGGDFNTVGAHMVQLVRRLLNAYGLQRANTGGGYTAERRVLGIPVYRGRLDHLYVRDLEVVAAGVVAGTTASDHRPVWARLAWADVQARPRSASNRSIAATASAGVAAWHQVPSRADSARKRSPGSKSSSTTGRPKRSASAISLSVPPLPRHATTTSLDSTLMTLRPAPSPVGMTMSVPGAARAGSAS
jgi:endonuclease/exonuclease/phosphatase family metal-dependent hydrolase